MSQTTRITIRVSTRHVDEAEQLVDDGEFANRSELVRDALREKLEEYRETPERKDWSDWSEDRRADL